jgi:flagellar hook-basal body complex protein FliE
MSIAPVLPVTSPDASMQAVALPPAPGPVSPVSFSQFLADGLEGTNQKAMAADHAVRAFILDDSIPVHQVSYALAQAKLSLELMLQVRSRLVEGYQQLMNMQM